MHKSFLDKARALMEGGRPFATAHITRRTQPTSGKPGDKAIITADSEIHGWIGGGCTRGIVLKEALASMEDRKPRLVRIGKTAAKSETYIKTYAMTCQSGGEVEVYIEPNLPQPSITIFGTSHIAMALAKLSKAMDYTVSVVMSNVDKSVFPEADHFCTLQDYQVQEGGQSQYVIVCTQGEYDAAALMAAIETDPPYLAFVASRLKANAIYSEVRNMGVSFDQLKGIKSPAGIDINAKTPEEVAISILAEIIEDFRSTKIHGQATGASDIKLSDDYYMNPVCKIPIQKSTAKHVLDYKGEQVYFCCDGCKVSFEKSPEQYMTA